MYVPALMAVTATVPFFATYMAEDEGSLSDDLIVVAYVCAVGLLVSVAAILDDSMALTSWFGLAMGPPELSML